MIRKNLLIVLTLVSFALTSYAKDTVHIPEQKFQTGVETTDVYSHEYNQETGFSFTPNSKPKYYDPIYHDYFMNSPQNMMINYPTFFMQGLGR